MKEVIQKIVKVDNEDLGYEIHTDKQVITIFISNSGSCCESWGVITTEDKLSDFIGAKIDSIGVVDEDYKTHPLTKADFDYGFDEGGVVFVDVNTSEGKLQFALYNSHNGYYGHSVSINCNQLQYECGV